MHLENIKWASSWDYGTYHIGDQRRLRCKYASMKTNKLQENQRNSHSILTPYSRNIKGFQLKQKTQYKYVFSMEMHTIRHGAKSSWQSYFRMEGFNGREHAKSFLFKFESEVILRQPYETTASVCSVTRSIRLFVVDVYRQSKSPWWCHSCDKGSHRKQCKIGLIHSSAQSSTTFID